MKQSRLIAIIILILAGGLVITTQYGNQTTDNLDLQDQVSGEISSTGGNISITTGGLSSGSTHDIQKDSGDIQSLVVDSSTGSSIDNQSNFNTYHNKRYGYSISYPSDRYLVGVVDEEDFIARGALGTLVGGDITISNYDIFEQTDGPFIPQDGVFIDIKVFKALSETTLEEFIHSEELNTMYVPIDAPTLHQESLTINQRQAIAIHGQQESHPSLDVYHTIIKDGDHMVVATYADNNLTPSTLANIRTIIESLTIK